MKDRLVRLPPIRVQFCSGLGLCFVLGAMLLSAAPTEAYSNQRETPSSTLARLALSGDWERLDDAYQAIAENAPKALDADAHYHAARAAAAMGDIDLWLKRLLVAKRAGNKAAGQELLLASRIYKRVNLVREERSGRLLRATFPVSDPTQRKAIRLAAKEMRATGRFNGWLPAGSYRLGGRFFNVKPPETTE